MKPLPPFQVIYQTAEDGLGDTVKPRLIEAAADLDRVLVIDEAKRELMPLVYVGSQHIFVMPLCYRVGKLTTYLMRLFITDFPRLKGLHEVVG